MIIISQVVGTGLTNIVVDENKFVDATSATEILFATFEYDGSDWIYDGNTITTAQLESVYGISFEGTPVINDAIGVAYNPQDLWVFSAGKGINSIKINDNFAMLQQKTNVNETQINTISNTALHKNGDNLEQSAINAFKQDTVTVLSTSGSVTLVDGGDYFLTPTNDVVITLPTVTADQYSHTISMVVAGSQYSVDLVTPNVLLGPDIDTTQDYSVLFLYNKIDNSWYYYIGQ